MICGNKQYRPAIGVFLTTMLIFVGCSTTPNEGTDGSDSTPGGDADADGDTDSDSDADSDADTDADTDSDNDTDTDTDSDLESDTPAAVDTATPDSDADTDSESDTPAIVDTATSDSDADTDAESDTPSTTDTATASIDTDTDTDTDINDTEFTETHSIPRTCAEAAQVTSTVGCTFFAVDLDHHNIEENLQFAVVVSNVHTVKSSHVTISRAVDSVWETYAEAEVAAMDLHQFDLPPQSLDHTGLREKGAYKISSDVPIIAYQFSPIDGASSFSSDASALIPTTSYNKIYDVVGWKSQFDLLAYFVVVAAYDNTVVLVEPSAEVEPGIGLSGSAPFEVTMNEGDVLEIATPGDQTLTGTRITTDVAHPVGVFTGHECADIPFGKGACDHLEEQLPGLEFWGTEFVASALPNRMSDRPDTIMWQIYAGEDDTLVTVEMNPMFTASPVQLKGEAMTAGLPESPFVLNRGEFVEFLTKGTIESPSDFTVKADRPIAVMQYMTGMQTLAIDNVVVDLIGDPAALYMPPVEQYLSRYVVLVPSEWIYDYLVITRKAGVQVKLDDAVLSDDVFTPVFGSGFEVAHLPVADGVHRVESVSGKDGLGLIVVGFDDFDSYAYTGGMGTGIINPILVV